MLHYSCDRCNRTLDPDNELRYVVNLEAYAALDPVEADEIDDDRDHLLEIQEIIERLEAGDDPPVESESVYQRQRYDLCSRCYREYMKNPVGRDLPTQIEFSEN